MNKRLVKKEGERGKRSTPYFLNDQLKREAQFRLNASYIGLGGRGRGKGEQRPPHLCDRHPSLEKKTLSAFPRSSKGKKGDPSHALSKHFRRPIGKRGNASSLGLLNAAFAVSQGVGKRKRCPGCAFGPEI